MFEETECNGINGMCLVPLANVELKKKKKKKSEINNFNRLFVCSFVWSFLQRAPLIHSVSQTEPRRIQSNSIGKCEMWTRCNQMHKIQSVIEMMMKMKKKWKKKIWTGELNESHSFYEHLFSRFCSLKCCANQNYRENKELWKVDKLREKSPEQTEILVSEWMDVANK